MGVILREISTREVTRVVKRLCIEANYSLREDVLGALREALRVEESLMGRKVLEWLVENARIAREEGIPICQDCGMVTVLLQLGQGVRIVGGGLRGAIDRGVREGYREGYLRKSVIEDPCFSRRNTGDNTPAIIYTEVIPGDGLKVTVVPKGAGSDNSSALKMLNPTDGASGVKTLVLETVKKAGANSCPPLVIGVGVGGSFDSVGLLSKKALLRPLDVANPDARIAQLEREILEEVNDLGIGPAGFGGRVTALSVSIETSPTHMASLPVAVNLGCHALRSAEAAL